MTEAKCADGLADPPSSRLLRNRICDDAKAFERIQSAILRRGHADSHDRICGTSFACRQKHPDRARLCCMGCLGTVGALIGGTILFEERLSSVQMIALAIILFGVVLLKSNTSNTSETETDEVINFESEDP